MTLNKYRTIDVCIFAGLAFVLELINGFAIGWVGEFFALSITVLLSVIVMMRWGWYCVFVSSLGALGYLVGNNGDLFQYAIYIVGSFFILPNLFWFKIVDKNKISQKFGLGLAVLLTGFVFVNIGRVVVAVIKIHEFGILLPFITADALNIVIGSIILWIAMRQENIFVDQIKYLKEFKNQNELTQLDGVTDNQNLLHGYNDVDDFV